MKGFSDAASNLLHFSEVPVMVQNHYLHFEKYVGKIYFFFV